MIKNKKGWIRIVEVFVAILLITGSLVLFINKSSIDEDELKLYIHDRMVPVLREIQENNSMRENILNAALPVEWEEFEDQGILAVRNKIIDKTPKGFECQGKVCSLEETCTITLIEEKNIYAETAFISSNEVTYSPRQLKIFCWQK